MEPAQAESGGPRRIGEGALEPGDVFVVANDTTETDPRAGIKGWGRILHCDHALATKAEIFTGDFGLVIGLALDQASGLLYATCPQLSKIMVFDRGGNPAGPPSFLPRRRYGNLTFDPLGRILIGVHSGHGEAPPEDGHQGKLVRFDPKTGEFDFFEVEIDGGRGGKHFVSNLALHPDGRTVFYVSEAGRRVARYDVESRRQLEDFLVFEEGDAGTYGMGITQGGRVVMALGTGAALFDPDGRLVRRYDLPAPKGWTRAKLAPDDHHFYIGNFLDGLLQRREIDSGRVVAELDIGRRAGLTSVVEYAPETR
jgi:sugar lactone lactonase YvrE